MLVRVLVFILDTLVALTATGGGLALVFGLEAERFSVEILRRTPFDSFVVPALLLAVVVGGSAAVAAFATLGSEAGGGPASVVAGVLLAGFILGEIALLDDGPAVSRTEAFYLAVATAIIALGGWMWRRA